MKILTLQFMWCGRWTGATEELELVMVAEDFLKTMETSSLNHGMFYDIHPYVWLFITAKREFSLELDIPEKHALNLPS